MNSKSVYLFDFTGEPMGRFADIKHLAKKIRRSESSVSAGLRSGGLIDSRFLVSYADTAIVPAIMSNPMFSNILPSITTAARKQEWISDDDIDIDKHINAEFENLRSNWQDVLVDVRSNKEYLQRISPRFVYN